jgi:hypothetical protein
LHELGVTGCAVRPIFNRVIVASEELKRLFFRGKMIGGFGYLLFRFFALGNGEAEVVACVGKLWVLGRSETGGSLIFLVLCHA